MSVTTNPSSASGLSSSQGSPRHSGDAHQAVAAGSADLADPDQPPECTNVESGGESVIEVADARAIASTDPLELDWMEDHLRKAVDAIDRSIARVSVQVIDEQQMKTLHERAFGDAIVTDVLSFDASQNDNQIEADIAVCLDVADRESSRRNHTVERELLLYALHGLLHCCGYDDHDEAGYEAMHAEEDRILALIGAGVTFGASAAGDAGVHGTETE